MAAYQNLFKDILILELASVLAGPLVGTFFSEMGAQVVKIENSRTGGDVTRNFRLNIEKDKKGPSAYYKSCNWGKDVRFLDLKDPLIYNEFLELVRNADVIISNFRLQTSSNLKVDFETLKSINPKLIYGQICGYHQFPDKKAYDMVLQAETGYLSMTGDENGNHAKIPIPMIDIMAAHHLKEAILLAYISRLKDGKGRCVSISLYDTAIASLTNQAGNYLTWGHIPKKMGTKHPNIPIYGTIFKSKDDTSFMIAAASDAQFMRLFSTFNIQLSETGLTVDSRYSDQDLIIAHLNHAFSKLDFEEIAFLLEKNEVPYGRINSIQDCLGEIYDTSLIQEEEYQVGEEKIIFRRIQTNIIREEIAT